MGNSKKRKIRIERALDRFQKMKRQGMAYILEELERRGGEADLKEFMGSIAVNYGIRLHTQWEYLQEMQYAGTIDISDGKIRLFK